MLTRSMVATLVASMAVTITVTVSGASPAAAKPGGWQIVPVQSEPANLVAMTALAANDVWSAGFRIDLQIVEGRPLVSFEPQVRHWNGTAWSAVPTPPLGKGNSGRLEAIAAAAADQIWAVGDIDEKTTHRRGSLIERWDGTTWSTVPADDIPDASHSLFGVAAISRTDAWAVGSADYPDHAEPVAQHWDGVHWTRVPLPTGLGSASLSAVTAQGPADVWAAGYFVGDPVSGLTEPLVLHWDGVSWTRVALPSTTGLGLARLNAITVSHGQVWAAGESTVGGAMNRKPLVFRIGNRRAVIERTPDEQGQLNAVTTVGPDIWAVGYRYDDAGEPQAYALRRGLDGKWRRAAVPEAVGATLFGITAVPGTRTLWTSGAMDGTEPGLPIPLLARFS